jgi:hypothetical protein
MPGEGQTIGVVRPAAGDAVSGDRPVHPTRLPVHHEVDDVLVEYNASSTVTDRRTNVVADVTFYVPAGEDVLASDHVRVPPDSAVLYRVVGRPEPWEYGDWEPGIVVQAKAVS